jgi:hypothetical protein
MKICMHLRLTQHGDYSQLRLRLTPALPELGFYMFGNQTLISCHIWSHTFFQFSAFWVLNTLV